MKRKLACLLFGVGILASGIAQARDSLDEALAAIPGDAMAFLCIPNVKALDTDYQQAVLDMGLQPFVQPPMNSLVGALKAKMPMFEGLDENGALTLVLMPAPSLPELIMNQGFIVSTQDPKAMIEAMGGVAGEGELWTVTLMGQPAHAAIGKNQIIVSQQAKVVTAIKDSESRIGAKLKGAEKKALEKLDLALWVDADRMFTLLKPMIDGFMVPMMMMQQSAGGFQAKSAEMNKKNIDNIIEGASSLLIGVALDRSGLGMRFAMNAKPGSELIKQFKFRTTTDSLLAGLPASKYLFAFGETIERAQLDSAIEQFDAMLTPSPDAPEELDTEKMNKLKGLILEAIPMLTGMSGTLDVLPPGPDGLFGLSLIVDTSDSKKSLELKSKIMEVGQELLAGMAEQAEEEELAEIVGAITFDAEAEEIAGVNVQHFKIDLSKIEDIEEEDLEDILKVIGKDGVLFRTAPVSPKRVVVAFGGGKARMGMLMEHAKKDEAPLENDAGIRKVAGALPKLRASVGYVAADRILAAINEVATVLEEEKLPVQIPPLDAPLAIASSGGDGWAQFDVFFPTELMVASKDAAMVMMGQQGAKPAPEPAPAPETP